MYDPKQLINCSRTRSSVFYHEYSPCPELRSGIVCYWTFSDMKSPLIHQPVHTILPDNCTDIIFNLRERTSHVAGLWTRSRPLILKPGINFLGIRFHPKTTPHIIKGNPAEFLNTSSLYSGFYTSDVLPSLKPLIDKVMDLDNASEIISVLDSQLPILLGSYEPCLRISGMIDAIVNCCGNIRSGDLAANFGVSEKQTLRYFRQHLGMTVKDFIKIVRFQCVLKHLLKSKSSNYFADLPDMGFYDQSHLIRNVKSYLGESPGKIIRMSVFYNS